MPKFCCKNTVSIPRILKGNVNFIKFFFAALRICVYIVSISAVALVSIHTSGTGTSRMSPHILNKSKDIFAPYRDIEFKTISVQDLQEKFISLERVILRYEPHEREQILSVLMAYFDIISDFAYKKNSAAFFIHNVWIYYDEGRMASEEYLGKTEYQSIFYSYSLTPLTKAYPPEEILAYTRPSDFYQALLNVSCCTRSVSRNKDFSTEVAHATREHSFLNKTVRMHPMAGKALQAVDADLHKLRQYDAGVHAFLVKIKDVFGYANKTVLRTQSSNISMHALGLAVDIIPHSYEGKEVYWVWTRNNYPKKWKDISLEKRWSVPNSVVYVFQEHGFIWGGKWNNFDTIHFEYRPEILLYVRMRSARENAFNTLIY